MQKNHDVIMIGCGFANGILAYRLRQVKPDIKILIIEQKKKLNAAYTWSFFAHDISADNMQWVSPLIKYSWDKYEVRFPKYTRFFNSRYNSIPAESLFDRIRKQPGTDFLMGRKAVEITPAHVKLEDGKTCSAKCIIDGRGYRDRFNFETGYQKFVGIDFTLKKPHNLSHPIIIDATIKQKDGFRLMYVLPWEKNKLMLEDTYYTLNPEMDMEAIKKDILAYAEASGWQVKSIDRTEYGCTAIPMQSDPDLREDMKKGIPMVGMRGGIINPMTGYASTAAIALADRISKLPELNNKTVSEAIKKAIPDILPPLTFTRLMDRMMFTCTIPDELHLLFQYFFNKNDGMVSRFFSGKYKFLDYVNIFTAVPPPLPYSRLLWLFKKK